MEPALSKSQQKKLAKKQAKAKTAEDGEATKEDSKPEEETKTV